MLVGADFPEPSAQRERILSKLAMIVALIGILLGAAVASGVMMLLGQSGVPQPERTSGGDSSELKSVSLSDRLASITSHEGWVTLASDSSSGGAASGSIGEVSLWWNAPQTRVCWAVEGDLQELKTTFLPPATSLASSDELKTNADDLSCVLRLNF